MPKYYEPDNFEDSYRTFLEKALSNNLKNNGSDYIDPDGGSVPDFYDDLACFLNGRENDCIEEKERYSFSSPLLSGYSKISVVRNNEKLFGLTSDQFGFRADEEIYEENNRHKYPLSRLLHFYKGQKKEEQEKIINRITEYVKNTRTIGGSFLWPFYYVEKCGKKSGKCYYSEMCYYNTVRGVGSYLEDRVDLTLLEIKHVINGRNNNNFEKCKSDIWLYDEYEKDGRGQKVNTHMKQWFDHFDSFQEYVEYFMLEPFCQKVMAKESEKGYDYIPLNIIDGEPIDEKKIDDYREKYKKNRKGEVQTLNKEELIDMLDLLEEMIQKRTEDMERAIESYREEQKISHTKQ